MTKAQQTQEKIIRFAIRTFCEKGYDGTSTKEISEMSGVSEATLFKYFRSKDNLFRIILDDLIQYFKHQSEGEVMKIIEDSREDTYTLLKNVVENRLLFTEKNDLALKILIQEGLINDKLKNLIETQVWPTITSTISRIFEDGIRKGDIRDLPIEYLTIQYMSTMAAPIAASYLSSSYNISMRSELVRQQFEFFYQGISTRPNSQ